VFDLDIGGHGVGGVLCVVWHGRKSRQSDEIDLRLREGGGIDDASFRRRLAGFGVRLGIVRLNGFNVSEMEECGRRRPESLHLSSVKVLFASCNSVPPRPDLEVQRISS
jgi:hypothetical protein